MLENYVKSKLIRNLLNNKSLLEKELREENLDLQKLEEILKIINKLLNDLDFLIKYLKLNPDEEKSINSLS